MLGPVGDHPLLAVTTSGQRWGIWLQAAERSQGATLAGGRGQPRDLLGTIDAVVARAGLSLPDLFGFAVNVGPGSFTSLRTGLATVRALAWALDKPVCAVAATAAYLNQARQDYPEAAICVAIGARQQHWYLAVTAPAAQPALPQLVAVGQLAAWRAQQPGGGAALVGMGPGWSDAELLRAWQPPLPAVLVATDGPDARWCAMLAQAAPPSAWLPALRCLPEYVAPSQAESQNLPG